MSGSGGKLIAMTGRVVAAGLIHSCRSASLSPSSGLFNPLVGSWSGLIRWSSRDMPLLCVEVIVSAVSSSHGIGAGRDDVALKGVERRELVSGRCARR